MKQFRIGNRLVESGVISEEQRDFALAEQKRTGERLGSVMRRLNLLSEDALLRVLSETAGVEYIQLGPERLDPDMASALPESLVRSRKVFPTAMDEYSITVAMTDPVDVDTIDQIQLETGRYVKVQCSSEFDILTAIDKLYGTEATITIEQMIEETMYQLETGKSPDMGETSSSEPVARLLDRMIKTGIRERASDIHFEPEKDLLYVRYRVDGVLHHGHYVPKEIESAMISRLKRISSLDLAERRLPQQGKSTVTFYGRNFDLHVATFPTIHGENAVVRVLHREQTYSLESLGFSERSLVRLKQAIEQPNGVVLITGPARSGKTTTLYSVLTMLKASTKKIFAIEDPVEFELPFVRQSQVNLRTGLTYSAGLHAMLRQDPDVILIGEMRDRETIDTAFRAALSGLLVLSTLHTNEAADSMPRLLDLGVEPYLVSNALAAVVSQRLVRVICKSCKVDAGVPSDLVRSLGAPPDGAFYKGAGCRACEGTGYTGRTLVSEVMLLSPRIRKAVLERQHPSAIRKIAYEEGMVTLMGNGVQKALAGITTLDEVARLA